MNNAYESEHFPLFAAQREILLDSLINSQTSSAYNIGTYVDLCGPVDGAILEKAIRLVTQSFSALRLQFFWGNIAKPSQRIRADASANWRTVDLSHEEDPYAASMVWMRQELRQPFELTQCPLHRHALIILGPRRQLFYSNFHHLIIDGISLGIVGRSIADTYSALSKGVYVRGKADAAFGDYVRLESDYSRSAQWHLAKQFWERQHAEPLEPVGLSVRLPGRACSPEFLSATAGYGGEQLSRLLSTANALGISSSMLLIAVGVAYMQRITGVASIPLGMPVQSRPVSLGKSLVSMCTNVLPMRFQVDPTASFRHLTKSIAEDLSAAFNHHQYRYEDVRRDLGRPHADLFRVSLNVVSPGKSNAFGECRALAQALSSGPIHELSIVAVDRIQEGELSVALQGNPALFAGWEVEAHLGGFLQVLNQVVADPDALLSDLALLSAQQREQVLVEWNRTAAEVWEGSLHERFAQQAQRTPEAVAVIAEEERLSYRELDERSSQLARHLMKLGVGPEVVVALCMERSAQMVVAVLGILKAGGVYLGLDASYPAERLAFMLADAQVAVLLTQASVAERLPAHQVREVWVDEDWAVIAREPASRPDSEAQPGNLAYVIYTSGSTGEPKGVAGSHGAMMNRIAAQEGIDAFTEEDICCQKTSVGFVDSIFETLGPLLNGRPLVVASAEVAKDPLALMKLIEAEGVTRLVSVPSLARALLGSADASRLAGLRHWTLSGEALEADTLVQLRQQLPECRFVNLYGSSEVAADATFYVSDGCEEASVPIGRPIANTHVYVLDKQLEPLPVGVIGELYVAGVSLARGYLNRPGLTAERFIANPFGEAGSRLYRTGDRVRYLIDGNIEYVGRIDQQVKIRGFRIEPAEVEARLRAHPGVQQAVVIVREDTAGEKRLVAYVVAREAERVGANDLRNHLKKVLPDYMVPTAFVLMARLPLTSSGKLDRNALPMPDSNEQREQKYVAPRTALEEALVRIWTDVLKVDRVGVNDNFFELGGHSLLATQVMARVRESFAVELPLRVLFEASGTVQELALHIVEAGRVEQDSGPAQLKARPRTGVLPLSFTQERLWFLEQLQSLGGAYNEAMPLHLEGQLDIAALERSLGDLIQRHETLRTRIKTTADGEGVQEIDAADEFHLTVEDLSSLPALERTQRAQQRAKEEALRPFIMERELFRVSLLRLAEQDHVLLVTIHHIMSDLWSLRVLLRDLSVLYTARRQGQPASLPPLEVQYADYALWQREWLQGEIVEKQLGYWRERLAGAPRALELPTDRPRPAIQSYNGARLSFSLSKQVTAALRELSRREGVTLYMVLLAAFQLLLSRWSGQTDIVVGSPIAGRTHKKLEGMIGFFVNTLVMRTDLSADPTFRELLKQVKNVALGAYAHQDIPFEKLIAEMEVDRDLSRQALFQVMLILQNQPITTLDVPELKIRPMQFEHTTSKFDLMIDFFESPDGLHARIEYVTELFNHSTIERFASQFAHVLEQVASRSNAKLSQITVLTELESKQLIDANRIQERSDWRCIHEIFSSQAAQRPNAVAVTSGGHRLTYAELDQRSNQLAHHLRELGVGPEVIVGLCMDRSPDMIVSLLAILKAGGAYLPIDPSYPQARIQYLIADSGIKNIVTTSDLVEWLGALAPGVGSIAADECNLDAYGRSVPDTKVTGQNLAYVIYTSGSTGRPKGVAQLHQNVVRLFNSTASRMKFDECDVWTLFHSISFDFSVWEIWGALFHGGRLVIVDKETARSSDDFLALLRAEKITVLNQTPAAFQQLLAAQAEPDRSLAGLRLVIFGGEALDIRNLSAWYRSANTDKHALINMYGITETTVHVTVGPLDAAHFENCGVGSFIGSRIPDLQTFVLNRNLDLQSVGVIGELYVGGLGLARGYLSQPGLTADRFVANPYGPPGSRMYRTGDLVRVLADGNLEYIGRIDDQVKIRGYRIELGEVEAALLTHGSVDTCAVMARTDRLHRQLVAYVVPRAGGEVDGDGLRSHLVERLPDYMVPSAFVFLAQLPLTAHGKVDRKALPAPDVLEQLTHRYEPPSNEIEVALTQIWSQVLSVPQVGIHDNFFELGGDSIIAIQVIAKAKQASLAFSARHIFEHQTVARLARVTRRSGIVPAEQGLISGIAPLTPIQHWFFQQEFAQPHHYNQSVMVDVPLTVDLELLEAALGSVILRHDAFRLRFLRSDAIEWQQCHAEDSNPIVLAHLDVRGLHESGRAAAQGEAIARLQSGLNFAEGPVIGACCFELHDARRLLLVCHHLVVDTVSWRVVLQDLDEAYKARVDKREAVLPPKTTSFKQWAERLSAHSQSASTRGERVFWEKLCACECTLPADGSVLSNTGASAKSIRTTLEQPDTNALLYQTSRAYRTQVNEVLLTALALTLTDWTQEPQILVALEGHGREDIFADLDLSRTVGWFTSIFPARIGISQTERSFGTALKSVKEQLRAIPGRGLGYGMLRYLGQDRQLQETLSKIKPEISFNYLGRLDDAQECIFRRVSAAIGGNQGEKSERTHQIDINCALIGGRLEIEWTYNGEAFLPGTMQTVANSYQETLRGLIAHCVAQDSRTYTPSDFPMANLDQASLNGLSGKAIDDIYPLSPLQRGLLFRSVYSPSSRAYFVQLRCTLNGAIDLKAFVAAWRAAMTRHDVLRTAFLHREQPLQVVYSNCDVVWENQDYRAAQSGIEESIASWLQTDVERSFVMEEPPLWRIALLQREENVHEFVFSVHHILLDGWSLSSLVREVFVDYHVIMRGRPVGHELSPPYREYIKWLQAQDETIAESFWRSALRDVELPTLIAPDEAATSDKRRESCYKTASYAIPAGLGSTLAQFAREHQLTLNTLAQGAWAILLSRYCGRELVCFGGTVATRPSELVGSEKMHGLMINTLPLPARVQSGKKALEWFQELQAFNAEARQYDYLPLNVLQTYSGIRAGQGMFDTLYVFENYPVDRTDIGAGDSNVIRASNWSTREQTHYPLAVAFIPGSTLSVEFIFDEERCAGISVERLAQQLNHVFEQVIARQNMTLGEIDILMDDERSFLLEGVNKTDRAYPSHSSVHELFELQAAKTPEAVALASPFGSLTYRQLSESSNQLAGALTARGLGPETVIGLCFERSIEMIVTMLGVLKAGGVYLPIDPELPLERIRYLLSDAGVKLVIAPSRVLEAVPHPERNCEWLANEEFGLERVPATYEPRRSHPLNLAYCVYTSGSTGTPKGVLATHQAIAKLIFRDEYAKIGGEDCIAHFSNPSFDASTFEVWGGLLKGARVLVVPKAVVFDEAAFARLLLEHGVTAMVMMVGLFNQYAEALAPVFRQLRLLMVGGEVLDPKIVNRVLQVSAPECMQNCYGPTEITTLATTFEIPVSGPFRDESIPIGRPISNTTVYVLDRDLNPLPAGIVGELYIGGPGLARGYLARPGLTADRFIADPFREEGERMYKTGDRVFFQQDGNLCFVGRADHQLKIRGFRVELEEIEAALLSHPGIDKCVVVARQESNRKQIVAYFVGQKGGHVEAGDLRAYLRERLPQYMLPSGYVALESLPLSAHGKVDRQMLPAPNLSENLSDSYVAARGLIEEKLAAIWAQLLKTSRVGIHDNFFELGGDSLLAMQMASRVGDRLSIKIDLQDLFEAPTIAGLSASISRGVTEALNSENTEDDDLRSIVEQLSTEETARWIQELQETSP